MKFNIADLDLDVNASTREDILNKLKHIPASKINDFGIYPHNVGVYFCDIPQDKITELASIDYKSAEEDYGFFKLDILHNTVYDKFSTRKDVEDSIDKEPNWNLLKNPLIVKQLPHINNYSEMILGLPDITSVEELAMFIALIRPGKKYLIEDVKKNGWKSIEDRIWLKEDNGFQFKKSHSIAYALSIVSCLNTLEKL